MKKYKVCACLLIKDENDYLEEWLDWHIKAGVEHFFIYDNGSKIPVVSSIGTAHETYCTVVDFSGAHGHIQNEAYADCSEQFGALTEWMAFVDTDEFIRVVDGTDLRLFLQEFEDTDVLVMRWEVYNADGQLKKASGPVRERFRATVAYPEQMPQCKCIVRPDKVREMGAHFPVWRHEGVRITDETHWPIQFTSDPCINHMRIVVDHYFTRSYEEWREKMARGSCDPCYSRGNEWFERMNPGLLEKEGDAV